MKALLIKLERHIHLIDVSFLQPSWELSAFDESSLSIEFLSGNVAFEDCENDPREAESLREDLHRIY